MRRGLRLLPIAAFVLGAGIAGHRATSERSGASTHPLEARLREPRFAPVLPFEPELFEPELRFHEEPGHRIRLALSPREPVREDELVEHSSWSESSAGISMLVGPSEGRRDLLRQILPPTASRRL